MQPVKQKQAREPLHVQRQEILRELARVNRRIVQKEEQVARIEESLATFNRAQQKAA